MHTHRLHETYLVAVPQCESWLHRFPTFQDQKDRMGGGALHAQAALSWGGPYGAYTHRSGEQRIEAAHPPLGVTLYGQLIPLPFEPMVHWGTATSKLGLQGCKIP